VKLRRLGSLTVSEIGLGCNNFGMRLDASETAVVVHKALDLGITLFDTAESYGPSEEYLGKALGKRRKDVIIATKFGNRGTGASPANIRRAVEDSLRRLKTDYIDLYQQHRPDPNTPIADTLGALHELITAGKVREVGCSNFTAEMLQEARSAAGAHRAHEAAGKRAHFVSVQNEYSLLHREPENDGVLAECGVQGLGLLPYFPLANGMLTGKYRKGKPKPPGTRISEMDYFKDSYSEERLEVVERLIPFAEARGHTLLELAFAWLLARPAVASVIAGATTVAQVEGNARAGGWVLSDEDLAALDQIAPASNLTP
jgi:aryl-alcohol dehydrogenase-like predicted oxidoreductase